MNVSVTMSGDAGRGGVFRKNREKLHLGSLVCLEGVMLLQLLTHTCKYHLGPDVRWTRWNRECGSRSASTLSEWIKITRERITQHGLDLIWSGLTSSPLSHLCSHTRSHSNKHRLHMPSLLPESNRVQGKKKSAGDGKKSTICLDISAHINGKQSYFQWIFCSWINMQKSFFPGQVWGRNHRPVISFPELSAFAPASLFISIPMTLTQSWFLLQFETSGLPSWWRKVQTALCFVKIK